LVCWREEKSYLVRKDPKTLATAALYGACLVQWEGNVNQARLAKAGGISILTLRKRVLDISELFPRHLQCNEGFANVKVTLFKAVLSLATCFIR
jgi:hypothetical protein